MRKIKAQHLIDKAKEYECEPVIMYDALTKDEVEYFKSLWELMIDDHTGVYTLAFMPPHATRESQTAILRFDIDDRNRHAFSRIEDILKDKIDFIDEDYEVVSGALNSSSSEISIHNDTGYDIDMMPYKTVFIPLEVIYENDTDNQFYNDDFSVNKNTSTVLFNQRYYHNSILIPTTKQRQDAWRVQRTADTNTSPSGMEIIYDNWWEVIENSHEDLYPTDYELHTLFNKENAPVESIRENFRGLSVKAPFINKFGSMAVFDASLIHKPSSLNLSSATYKLGIRIDLRMKS